MGFSFSSSNHIPCCVAIWYLFLLYFSFCYLSLYVFGVWLLNISLLHFAFLIFLGMVSDTLFLLLYTCGLVFYYYRILGGRWKQKVNGLAGECWWPVFPRCNRFFFKSFLVIPFLPVSMLSFLFGPVYPWLSFAFFLLFLLLTWFAERVPQIFWTFRGEQEFSFWIFAGFRGALDSFIRVDLSFSLFHRSSSIAFWKKKETKALGWVWYSRCIFLMFACQMKNEVGKIYFHRPFFDCLVLCIVLCTLCVMFV